MVSIDFTSEWPLGDLRLIVSEEGEEDKVLYANSGTISVWSPVFAAMLKDGLFKEGASKEVKMPGKKYDDVLELLKVLHPPNPPVTCKLTLVTFWFLSLQAQESRGHTVVSECYGQLPFIIQMNSLE